MATDETQMNTDKRNQQNEGFWPYPFSPGKSSILGGAGLLACLLRLCFHPLGWPGPAMRGSSVLFIGGQQLH
jgi:hypothetical protein